MKGWHAKSASEIQQHFATSLEQGLTSQEAERRLAENGPNELPTKPAIPAWKRFLLQFNNLLIYVLLVAALLAGILAEWLDMAVILAVVIINASIGFYQEGRAEKALNAIQKMLQIQSTVRRSGKSEKIPARNLVVGDIVILDAGDKVPADLRLLSTHNVAIQEAPLTGESVAVEKSTAAIDSNTPLADRNNMAYFGTLVTQGRAVGVVIATGVDTELGRINRLLNKVTTLTTPLIQQMAQFAKYLTLVVVGFGLLVFLFGLLRGNDPTYLFMAVVSLIVAAIPEGLPTVLTVALAIGVTRLAHRKSIIRKLPAVETLGAVSTICSDKTGTLTRNEMMVAQIATESEAWVISGSGYNKDGAFSHSKFNNPDADTKLINLLHVGVLCNDSEVKDVGNAWEVVGDPMEGALLVAAQKAQISCEQITSAHARVDFIPFDSRHKYMATLHNADFFQFGDEPSPGELAQKRIILIKGAPERIIAMAHLSKEEEQGLHEQIDNLATNGMRVLGFAYKFVNADCTKITHDDLNAASPSNGIHFLGFAGLIDPPREEAKQAIAECKTAGIQVKMITGDHLGTAKAIGAQLGLENTDNALSGTDIDNMSDEDLAATIGNVNIYARTTPEHKLRLVTALQKNGDVVAMTGDGVNDAPALKRADVGIAMGKSGTEAAREASEMVITDDNFASIVSAVRAGRTVYDNLKKAIGFLLPVNGGESLAIILALLFALTLPIMPLQILWVNMVSSIALALALAFERSEPGVMQRPPRNPLEPLISRLLLWRIVFVSVVFTVGIFSVFQWSLAQGLSESYARTMAVNTLVAMEVWYLFSVRYLHGKSLSLQGIKGTPPVLIAVCLVFVLQAIFTYVPFMQQLFGTTALTFQHGLICVGIGILVFFVLETEKAIRKTRLGKTLQKQ
ncbi:MAG: HAD-IC family P-type ATPase [Idiomarina sp.]|nr:HAD-IC family P-type ATPase [Idiomarina sp.]